MLTGASEDNVLTALVYGPRASSEIATRVTPNLFSTRGYRQIAEKAIEYTQKYHKPGGVHIQDELEEKMRGSSPEAAFLKETFGSMARLKDEMNEDYILDQLAAFIQRRKVMTGLEKAASAANTGEIDKAREIIHEAFKDDEFSHGIRLYDTEEALRFLNRKEEEDFFSSGVDELDKRGVRPHRKTMFLILAPSNRGKSWGLVEIGKQNAYIYNKSVLHITLEMSEDDVAQRYIQSMFAMTRGSEEKSVRTSFFERDEFGRFVGFEYGTPRVPEGVSRDMRKQIEARLNSFKAYKPIIIKEFPMSSLTIPQLESYMDSLEHQHKFIPDLLIIDYADIMEVDHDSLRTETGRVFKQLRGVASRRNLALATATQGNRKSSTALTVREDMISEDWSKVGTTDFMVTYSQTASEEKRGLARLWVEKARTAKKHYTIMISQNYDTGQFCLDSVLMNKASLESAKKVIDKDDED